MVSGSKMTVLVGQCKTVQLNGLLKYLPPINKSNLEVVLDNIARQEEVRNVNIAISDSYTNKLDISKDLHFIVGKRSLFNPCFKYFKVKFGDRGRKCVVTAMNSNDPIFLFSNIEEIGHIRKAVTNKYKEMLTNKGK